MLRPPPPGRLRRLAPLALALAVGSLAVAAPGWARRDAKGREIEAWTGEPLFALTSPWSGATLAAGESLALSWRATDALAGEAWLEEWEAFLSLDAGRSYRIRLTPHLDLAKSSFAVRLPDVATREARLMFRMGNERRELEIELPWTFEIVAAPRAAGGALLTLAFVNGESPRGVEQGVVAWVEGARDGSGTREYAAVPHQAGIRSVAANAGFEMAALGAAPRRSFPPSCALRTPTPFEAGAGAESQTKFEVRPARFSPLDKTCRRNE